MVQKAEFFILPLHQPSPTIKYSSFASTVNLVYNVFYAQSILYISCKLVIAHACMVSRFSHDRLCVTPWITAHQTPLPTGYSRLEYWSGFPFLLRFSHKSSPTLCGPMDFSPPGSSAHGVL